jgi:hypothetical protein
MKLQSFVTIVLLCFLCACKLRIDNPQDIQDENQPEITEENIPQIVIDSIPPLDEVETGRYAMQISGNAPASVKGFLRGSASFARTNTPILNANGLGGKIRGEIRMSYNQDLIRVLKVYFADEVNGINSYALLPYEEFKERLPLDSIASTYSVASGFQFSSREGSLQIISNTDQMLSGKLLGTFFSEKGDSLVINIHFKAVKD